MCVGSTLMKRTEVDLCPKLKIKRQLGLFFKSFLEFL